ncbi:MAG: hypothetical protein WD025_05885 [Bacteriovoracaceae bacterium]
MAEVSVALFVIFACLGAFLKTYYALEKKKARTLEAFEASWKQLDEKHGE